MGKLYIFISYDGDILNSSHWDFRMIYVYKTNTNILCKSLVGENG